MYVLSQRSPPGAASQNKTFKERKDLWKERNRRIFDNAHKTAQQVASLTKEDIMQRRSAMSFDG
jgi:uncharacterized phage-like protein YoqJ